MMVGQEKARRSCMVLMLPIAGILPVLCVGVAGNVATFGRGQGRGRGVLASDVRRPNRPKTSSPRPRPRPRPTVG